MLDLKKFMIVPYTDAAFSTNSNGSTQLGYFGSLSDDIGACKILHYSSSKSIRVACSVLWSEIYTFVGCFDI